MKGRVKISRKTAARLLSAVLGASMVIGAAGCGGESGTSTEDKAAAGDRTVIYYAASYVTAQTQASYEEMVDTYNNTQGVEDNVYVQMRENSGAISGLDSALNSDYQYDVLQLNDDEYKALAVQGKNFFVTLDDYLTDDAKSVMNWSDIPQNLVDRFRINSTTDDSGMYLAGEGADLLALPIANNPFVLYYNSSILEECGINIISVAESELDAYNTANNANLKPHGYSEYKEAPFEGAVSSVNEAGQTVYKVFNNRIAMNWEELRCVSRAFQKQYGYEYGYMSEWWFNYGWSVGGDCVGWNESDGQYELTLADKQPNYLVLSDTTVNGRDYKKGDVLLYEDKSYVNQNDSEKSALAGKLYELPSSYDATLEFNRLGVPTDKQAEDGVYGYGVAPTTTTNRTTRFTSGTDCPFLIESFSLAQSFKNILGDSVDMTLPAQYREYEGGSTYQNGGDGFASQYLKVIGETYDGEVYTGDLHYEGDTAVVGRSTTASEAAGLFLPANTKGKNYDAAFKFASWVAGPEGQAILAKGNEQVPNQTTYGLTDYADSADRLLPNMWAGAYLSQKTDIGDYTYFTSVTWITEWSTTFNKDVREGNMTLTAFDEAKKASADTSLKGMRIHILGR